MKRYQCIKTYRFGEDVPFTAGKLYNFVNVQNTDILEVVDNNGEAWTVDEYLAGHFQELLDLNVDEIEQEREQYVMQESRGCSGMFWALVITAVIITLYAIFS